MFSRIRLGLIPNRLKPGALGLSFIGVEVVVSGDVATDAQLHVDGRIDGHVRCVTFCQGKSGIVAGNIHADDARISGLVEGDVFADDLVLEPSARILGDITYQTISIAAGAQVEGRLARRAAVAVEPLADSAPPILTVTPIPEPVAVPKPPRKGERSDKTDKTEPPLVEDIFSLTPSSQAGAH